MLPSYILSFPFFRRRLSKRRQLPKLRHHLLYVYHLPGLGSFTHTPVNLLPRDHHPRLVHRVEGEVHIREQVLDCFDHIQPDQRPEPAAPRGGLVVANLYAHLELAGVLAYLRWLQRPKGLQVVVYLVPEVFDDNGVLALCKLVPFVESRRWVPTPPFAIGGRRICKVLRFFGYSGRELYLGGFDQLIDGVFTREAPSAESCGEQEGADR